MYPLYPRLLIGLLAGFISFTIAGTLSHEAGHFVVAKYCGFDASIHYGYTSFDQMPTAFKQTDDTIRALHDKYKLVRKRGRHYILSDSIDFPEKRQYEALIRRQQQTLFLIDLGGPLQTMLTGTAGFVLLTSNRRWWAKKKELAKLVWVIVFATLFWLRQSFNLAMATYGALVGGSWPSQMDETKLAIHLHLWPATISLVTGLTGLSVLAFVTLRVIPAKQRLTFIVSGLVGGSFGFWFWLIWLGPIVMP